MATPEEIRLAISHFLHVAPDKLGDEVELRRRRRRGSRLPLCARRARHGAAGTVRRAADDRRRPARRPAGGPALGTHRGALVSEPNTLPRLGIASFAIRFDLGGLLDHAVHTYGARTALEWHEGGHWGGVTFNDLGEKARALRASWRKPALAQAIALYFWVICRRAGLRGRLPSSASVLHSRTCRQILAAPGIGCRLRADQTEVTPAICQTRL